MAAVDGSNWTIGVNSCCFCGAGNAKKCGGCHSIAYCGKECQVKDWKRGHKIQCRLLRVERYELASAPRAPSSPLVVVFSLISLLDSYPTVLYFTLMMCEIVPVHSVPS
jgi:hypothetical protein